jgi:hypothetical protein
MAKVKQYYFEGKKLLNPAHIVTNTDSKDNLIDPYNCSILILGHAEHGKDTFVKYLVEASDNVLTSCSSSYFMADYVFKDMLNRNYISINKYKDKEDCYADRRNHRSFWFNSIKDFNESKGLHSLAESLTEEYNIYTGMRNIQEYYACIIEADIFDLIIWVEASERKPLEHSSSISVKYSNEMLLAMNNTTLKDLKYTAFDMYETLFQVKQ